MLTERFSTGNCGPRFFPPGDQCGFGPLPQCECSIVEELDRAMDFITLIPPVERIGVTKYDTKKTWNGYTMLGLVGKYENADGKLIGGYLIDMDGNVINEWELTGIPAKMFPGGIVMGGKSGPDFIPAPGASENYTRFDWCGNEIPMWGGLSVSEVVDDDLFAGVHHDFEVEGSAVGYYCPGEIPRPLSGRTLVLSNYYPCGPFEIDCTGNETNHISSNFDLMDDAFYEIDEDGDVTFEWHHWEHFEASGSDLGMGYDNSAKDAIDNIFGGFFTFRGTDWQHSNTVSRLGHNKWYTKGDDRFHPDNIIYDSRSSNYIAIIARHNGGGYNQGDIVWRVGPHYTPGYPEHKLDPIIGPHNAHMIPKTLPGGGNILVFDNGGVAGYGALLPGLPGYHPNTFRDYSRVVEFDPVTLRIVWEYKNQYPFVDEDGFLNRNFYSRFISSAQRLPNGNTLITDGGYGRIFEVTVDGEIVWEFINPTESAGGGPPLPSIASNAVYRAYRVPYSWAPNDLSCPAPAP